MATVGKRVDVSTTAVELTTSDGSGSSVVVVNPSGSGVTVDLGGPDVTTGGGMELAPGGETPALKLDDGDSLYAVAASGTVELQVLEVGV